MKDFTQHIRRASIFMLLIFTGNNTFAQSNWFAFDSVPTLQEHSSYICIYKIPVDSVHSVVYPQNSLRLDALWLQHPVYTIPYDEWRQADSLMSDPHTPPGYYMKVTVQDRARVVFDVRRRAGFTVAVNDLREIQLLTVTDSAEHSVKDAIVTIGKKRLAYDSILGGYIVHRFLDNATISIRKGDDIQFYNCSLQKNYEYERAQTENPTSRQHERNLKYNGYLVTNKPIYRPGDTVKFKAYLEYPNDNSLANEPISVSFTTRSYYPDKKYEVFSALQPEAPGVYFSEFVLGDSVKTGQEYVLKLNGTKFTFSIEGIFKTEDYLLDEMHMKVTGEKYRMYQHGDSINLYAAAFDANNLPVMDGKYEITVVPSNYTVVSDKPVFIPDTLYHYKTATNADGETYLGFSTNDFPDAKMTLKCMVSLINSNAERRDTVFYIQYTNATKYIDVALQGNTVKAQLISNKHFVTGRGTYMQQGSYGVQGDSIAYPFERTVQPTDITYTFRIKDSAGPQEQYYYVTDATLNGADDYVQDTAYLLLQNPQHVQYKYSMYMGNKFIGYGCATRDTLLKIHTRKGRTVTILGRYLWKGMAQEKRFDIYKMNRNLIINMRKKDFVYPGQKDTIGINLTNKDLKGIGNTNVTVLAFNSQFKEDYVPELPYGGLLKPALEAPRFFKNINELRFNSVRYGVPNERTLALCGADTVFFYKNLFLLPHKVAWLVYNLPDSAGTQAAFYVKQGTDFIQPHIIYIDGQPVYFSSANTVDANSFFVTPGMHYASFRTTRGVYTIHNFEVCAQHKTNLFINIDSIVLGLPCNAENHYPFITADSLPDTLALGEKDVLGRHMLLYRGVGAQRPLFIQQHTLIAQATPQINMLGVYPSNYDYQNVALIGPFPNLNDSMCFYQYRNTKLRFMPELHYVFTFLPSMTRVEKQSIYGYLNMHLQKTTTWPEYGFIQSEPPVFDLLDVYPPAPKKHSISIVKKIKWPYSPPDYVLVQSNTIKPASIAGNVFLQRSDSAIHTLALHRIGDTRKPYIWDGYYANRTIAAGDYEVFIVWNNWHFDKLHLYINKNGTTVITIKYKGAEGKFSYEHAPAWLKSSIYPNNPENKITKGQSKHKPHIPYTTYNTNNSSIEGIVIDNKKEPVINAIVQFFDEKGILKGTALTDYDGNYKMPVTHGIYEVVTRLLGYYTDTTTGVIVHENETIKLTISLQISSVVLKEVVRHSYKVPIIDPYVTGGNAHIDREELEHAPILTTDELVSTAPGVYQAMRHDDMADVSIAGARSEGTLYIIDGVQVRGNYGTNLSQGSIDQVDVTSGTAAKYGDNAGGVDPGKGKYILSSAKSKSFINNFLNNPMQASGLRKNFRDWAIWEPNLWTNNEGNTSFAVTYPDNITSWKTYVLAMNSNGYAAKLVQMTRAFKPLGAQLSAPRFLRYGDSLEVVGKVMNYTPQAFDITTTFVQNGITTDSSSFAVHNTHVNELFVAAPVANRFDTAQLSLAYTMTTPGGYTDGEERILPVLPIGTTESKGDFVRMLRDTTFSSTPNAADGHFTGKTNICVDGSLLEVMLREIEHLKVYPYGCSEQLTSKLLAVYYEEEVKRILHIEELNNTKAKKEILEKLVRAQKSDGSFPWWPGGGNTDPRITNYVLSTMQKINKDHWLDYIIRRGLDYLNTNLDNMSDADRITSLATLSQAGYAANYKTYVDKITMRYLDRYNRFAVVKIKKEQGLPYRKDLDTLVQEAAETENGVYWKQYNNYDWYRNDIATTLLAYKVVRNDSIYDTLADKVISYLLFERRDGYYQNTAESGLVLSTLLPELTRNVDVKNAPKETTVAISGSLHDTVKSFPKFYTIKNGTPQFIFTKKGISPAFVTVAYEYFNPAPMQHNGAFSVSSVFLSNRDTVTYMKQGEKTTLRVTVSPTKEADYVMIEIPIPAGCVQVNKQPYNYWLAGRENFKDRTVIFCQSLSKGTYTFDVELEARYKGRFTINPARASMMYYPKEYGNTDVKKVSIK